MSKVTDKLIEDIIQAIELEKRITGPNEKEFQRQVIVACTRFGLELLDDVRAALLLNAKATERLVKSVEDLTLVQKRRD